MIRIKIIHNRPIILVVLSALLYFTSCKQNWYCYANQYNITAIKGADTVYNQINIVIGYSYAFNKAYTDSVVNYYKDNGYSVSIDTSLGSSQNVGNDKSELKALEEDGFICTQSN